MTNEQIIREAWNRVNPVWPGNYSIPVWRVAVPPDLAAAPVDGFRDVPGNYRMGVVEFRRDYHGGEVSIIGDFGGDHVTVARFRA